MSLDDQLFKQDGTLLTRVDVAVLKLAQSICNLLFADADDTNYSPALRRIAKTGGLVLCLSGVFGALNGSLLGTLNAILIGGYCWIGANSLHCDGRGTLVPNEMKKLGIFSLVAPMLLLTVCLALDLIGIDSRGFSVAYDIFYCTGLLIYCFANAYVMRLHDKPPRRKRARVFRLAFNNQ